MEDISVEETGMEEKTGKGRKKTKLIAILAVIAAVSALFLVPEAQKNQFQKSTDANFSSVPNKDLDEGDLEKLKAEYDEAGKTLKNNGYDLEANLKKADILYRMQEYDKAIAVYKKMQEKNPADARPLQGLGSVYFIEKKYQDAKYAYEAAIKNDAENLDAYLQLGRIYRITGKETDDRDAVKKFYEDGISRLGDSKLRLMESYADCLERIGENDKAMEQLNAAFAVAPDEDKESVQVEITKLQAKMAAPAQAPAAQQ